MSYLIGGIIVLVIAAVLIFVGFKLQEDVFGGAVSLWIVGAFAILLSIYLFWAQYNTADGQRDMKSFKSDKAGGLVRTVDVYDYDGKLINHYEGKLDVQTNEAGTKVLFDLDGKRTIIYGGIVVVQEK